MHSVAVVCLTLENRTAPWLLFEAGALSKALNKAYVCPLLLGLEPADVQGPLAQFQLTRTTKDDVRKLLGMVNGRLEAPLSDSQLDAVYNAFWPDLEKRLLEISVQGTPTPGAKRQKEDILAEVLERVRGIERRLDTKAELGAPDELAGNPLVNPSRPLGDYSEMGALNSLMGLARQRQAQPPTPAPSRAPLGSLASAARRVPDPVPAKAGPKGAKR